MCCSVQNIFAYSIKTKHHITTSNNVLFLFDSKPTKQHILLAVKTEQHIFVDSNKGSNIFSLEAKKQKQNIFVDRNKTKQQSFAGKKKKRIKDVFAGSNKTKSALSLTVSERNNTFTLGITKNTTDYRRQATISKHTPSKAMIRKVYKR